jgi:hypothetical protein
MRIDSGRLRIGDDHQRRGPAFIRSSDGLTPQYSLGIKGEKDIRLAFRSFAQFRRLSASARASHRRISRLVRKPGSILDMGRIQQVFSIIRSDIR